MILLHTCSNDLQNNSKIYLFSLILSIFTFFILLIPTYATLEAFFNTTIPIWIETPSIIGLYGCFNKLFDKFLWKCDAIRWFGLPKIPDLNGVWTVNILSSHNDGVQKQAEATISQTFSKFCMVIKTDESVSQTTMAAIELENPIFRTITYTYICKPLANSKPTMNIHEGTGRLEILEGDTKLKGYYYSGRGRQNFGDIDLQKET
ncbi:MAG: hypothetical protein ACOWW1_05645 [archaeon]